MLKLEQIKDFPTCEKFLVTYYGNQLKAYKESKDTLFILAKGKHSRGYRSYANSEGVFNNVELVKLPTKEDKNEKWYKSLKRVIKLLEESGLWDNIKEVYENLLKYNITLEDIKKISDFDSYENRDKVVDFCKSNGYGFMIYKDKEGIECLDRDYIYEVSRCELKSMYFGKSNNKWYKERIQKAFKDKTPLSLSETVNYDVSFEYNPETKRAWYSEEYRGCGNGHYYLALNYNTALFYEND